MPRRHTKAVLNSRRKVCPWSVNGKVGIAGLFCIGFGFAGDECGFVWSASGGCDKLPAMKWLLAILSLLLVGLQYRLWVGEGSYAERARLEREILGQQAENERLRERNRLLAVEVKDLKTGHDAIEKRARTEMGMIKKGETFFMLPEQNANP